MPNSITTEMINKRIYQQFIQPTTQNKNYIGIEIELPIVNLQKQPVNFKLIHSITEKFKKDFPDFTEASYDYEKNIYSLRNPKTDDVLCYDCSYNNIEFAMGPEKELFTINHRFKEYYKYLKDQLEQHNHTITGMGINPYRKYNRHIPIASQRYLMLYHHLQSYKNYKKQPINFHRYPEYGMFSSASQVQLDIQKNDLIKSINTFTKIEAIKALLFSNSVFYEEDSSILCYRDLLWEYSTHGINPRNIGMYEEEFQSIDDLIDYIRSLNMYCLTRDNSYINFPSMNLTEYLLKDNVIGDKYVNGKYNQVNIKPSLNDIKCLRPFKFINLTYRGTLEFRSICTQPLKDTMTTAAFHLGLKENMDKLDELINNDNVLYNNNHTPAQLRKILIHRQIPDFIDKDKLYDLTKQIVDLSSEGLQQRGIGEEKYLNPLYERIKKQTNPAKDMIDALENNIKIEKIIKDYSRI